MDHKIIDKINIVFCFKQNEFKDYEKLMNKVKSFMKSYQIKCKFYLVTNIIKNTDKGKLNKEYEYVHLNMNTHFNKIIQKKVKDKIEMYKLCVLKLINTKKVLYLNLKSEINEDLIRLYNMNENFYNIYKINNNTFVYDLNHIKNQKMDDIIINRIDKFKNAIDNLFSDDIYIFNKKDLEIKDTTIEIIEAEVISKEDILKEYDVKKEDILKAIQIVSKICTHRENIFPEMMKYKHIYKNLLKLIKAL